MSSNATPPNPPSPFPGREGGEGLSPPFPPREGGLGGLGPRLPPPGSPVLRIAGVNHFFGAGDTRTQVLFDNTLEVLPGELVIDKPGKGMFHGTDVDALLRGRGITHLLFTGVTTEVCVQTSMREANDRGYECLLVEDGTASYFPEFKAATLAMLTAQGAIVGWSAPSSALIEALA